LARYRSEMTTFFKRFPARRNRTVHSGLIFRIVAQWVIYFDWKKKFAGLGDVTGGSHEYILQGKFFVDRGVALNGAKAELGVWAGGSEKGPKMALLTSYVFIVIFSHIEHVKTCNGRYLPKESFCLTICQKKVYFKVADQTWKSSIFGSFWT
jgi:hypothetical protein